MVHVARGGAATAALAAAYPGRGGITDIARRDADRRQIRNWSAFAGFILGTGTAGFAYAMADWADRRRRAQPAPRPVQLADKRFLSPGGFQGAGLSRGGR